jgi:hypothetical protein
VSGEVVLVNGRVILDERPLAIGAPAIYAAKLDAGILILVDPDARPGDVGQFQNLMLVAPGGATIWVAELPTTGTGDAYYSIESLKPLIALSVSSYRGTIDPATGRLVDVEFVK